MTKKKKLFSQSVLLQYYNGKIGETSLIFFLLAGISSIDTNVINMPKIYVYSPLKTQGGRKAHFVTEARRCLDWLL